MTANIINTIANVNRRFSNRLAFSTLTRPNRHTVAEFVSAQGREAIGQAHPSDPPLAHPRRFIGGIYGEWSVANSRILVNVVPHLETSPYPMLGIEIISETGRWCWQT